MGYIFVPIYGVIFATAVFGNSIFLGAMFRNKHLRLAVYIFLANETLSDLLFAIFSLAFASEFMLDNWVLNEISCRIIGPFIEICYTVSILSLTAVAIERYHAICRYSKAKRTVMVCIRWCAAIWFTSVVFCSPLFYAYNLNIGRRHSNHDNNTTGDVRDVVYACETTYWSTHSAVIFHSVHAVFIYLLPLAVMIYTHVKIAQKLGKRIRPRSLSLPCNNIDVQEYRDSSHHTLEEHCNNNRFSRAILDMEAIKYMKEQERNKKVVQMLIAVTVLFVVLWTPFIVGRIIWRVTSIEFSKHLWCSIELLILTSTATNFFVYLRMSPEFRRTFLTFFRCCRNKNRSRLVSRTCRNKRTLTSKLSTTPPCKL